MNSISLQSFGQVPAIKAEDLTVGMRRMYNFGITHEVVAIAAKGKQSLAVTTRSNDGALCTATVRRNSLVAVAA